MKNTRDSYSARQAKAKREREAKKRSMKALLASIDRAMAIAVESDAYHEGEVSDLSDARHSVMAVLGGYSRQANRR